MLFAAYWIIGIAYNYAILKRYSFKYLTASQSCPEILPNYAIWMLLCEKILVIFLNLCRNSSPGLNQRLAPEAAEKGMFPYESLNYCRLLNYYYSNKVRFVRIIEKLLQNMETARKQMKILKKVLAKKTFPTGDPTFSTMQAFPAGIPAEESDPFLMCDYFGPSESKESARNPDHFPIGWHPHRGMDICTYMKQGVGRHADSLGNREEFATPGMQWISVGSGIEHAEGGGTPKGQIEEGFQLWFNTPAVHKMDDPRYGTEDPSSMPLLNFQNFNGIARLLAGEVHGKQGPFKTIQPLQMIDFELPENSSITHSLPESFNNCILFIYKGSGSINGQEVGQYHVLRLDGKDSEAREISMNTKVSMNVILFGGVMIKEPIAWHGPFVTNLFNHR